MDALMASGFITPPSLHYVRNHGAVPKIDWSAHRLTINGLVDTPITLTMDQLVALPSVTLPVTLVCAGNRCVRVSAPVCPCVRYAETQHCCQHTQHARSRHPPCPVSSCPVHHLHTHNNRRKEENMHKKSIGFNWGPCAVSTGYWTGVRISTLLKMAGVRTGEGSAAAYVSFRGPKGELPKGDDGSYGECGPLRPV